MDIAPEMLMMLDLQRQFVEVQKSEPGGVFIGAQGQYQDAIMPGLHSSDIPLHTMNQYDATSYFLSTTQQGFVGTNNPVGVRQLYNAGASAQM